MIRRGIEESRERVLELANFQRRHHSVSSSLLLLQRPNASKHPARIVTERCGYVQAELSLSLPAFPPHVTDRVDLQFLHKSVFETMLPQRGRRVHPRGARLVGSLILPASGRVYVEQRVSDAIAKLYQYIDIACGRKVVTHDRAK